MRHDRIVARTQTMYMSSICAHRYAKAVCNSLPSRSYPGQSFACFEQFISARTSGNMRATLAKSFGEPRDVLSVVASHPKPVLQPKSKDLLIHVKACSLSPGDYRRLRGEADGALGNVDFPYIPGGDVCGIVEDVGEEVQGFRVGDEVPLYECACSWTCTPSSITAA